MPDYGTEKLKKKWGCSVFGWVIFALAFAALLVIGWRTYQYYGMIRRGEIVELPQFRSKFTTGRQTVVSYDVVERSAIEREDEPAVGADASAAKLTIVEFADFECPFSKEASSGIRSMAAKYGDKVRVIYRDYPLDGLHLNARPASLAAECAREQGKFWAYHDKLYLSSSLASADLTRYAAEVGLDSAQFDKCFVEERYAAKVDADVKQAEALGLSGTPVFFFNGQKVEGAIPDDQLERIVTRLIQ